MVDVGVADEWLRLIIGVVVLALETCGVAVIAIGAARTFVGFLRTQIARRTATNMTRLRLDLGKAMVLALEFQVAADILKTGLSPEWQEILLLAATIAVRTVMNLLLERELDRLGHDYADREGEQKEDQPCE